MKTYLLPTFIISFLIIVIVIGCYFIFYYLSRNKEIELLSKNQLVCSELEEKVKDNYNKKYGFSGSLISYLFSQNHYNRKFQKCIVTISYRWNIANENLAYSEEYIVDAVENNGLIQCSERVWKNVKTDTCSKNGETITKTEFDTLKQEYMTE